MPFFVQKKVECCQFHAVLMSPEPLNHLKTFIDYLFCTRLAHTAADMTDTGI